MPRKSTGSSRTEEEYAALADSFERGEFSPVGDVWVAADADKRLAAQSAVVSVALDEEEDRRLDELAHAAGIGRSDVVKAAVAEYLERHTR